MAGKHAIFAPSSTARWLKCPASALIGADLPERTSEASEEGTRVHALIEKATVTGTFDHIDDDDDYWIATLVCDFVRKLEPGSLAAERRVVVNDHVWGTADTFHLAMQFKLASILDYKNGGFDVEVVGNKQLLSYAVGTLREFPWIEWFRLGIVQPNSRTNGETEPIKQWIVPASTVAEHARAIDQAVARGLQGEKPIPGRHCRWCDKFGVCDETSTTLGFIMTAVQFAPTEITDDMIIRVARVLRGLGDFKKLVEEEMERRMVSGRQIGDALLERSNSHRRWRDEMLAKRELHARFGLEGLSAMSPAEAEKLGADGKALAATLAYKPPGKPKVSY